MGPRGVQRLASVIALAAALAPASLAPARAETPRQQTAAVAEHGERARPSRRSRMSAKERRQEEEARRLAEEERKKYAVQPETAEVFAEAREELAADRFREAERALRKLRRAKLSPYESAQLHRLHGYIAYGQNENAAAIEHLGKALAGDALPPADQADVLFQVAQIQGVEKRWRDGIATLDRWFQVVETPNSVGYYLKALAHFQLQELDAAVEPARQAIALGGAKPQQAWLQLLLAIQLSRKDYAAATPVLVEMISHYPESAKGYWLQLSALYGVTDDMERALAVMEIAYRKGIVTEHADLVRLVQLNLLRGIPRRAAEILEREMFDRRIQENPESFELLAGSWILAREIPKAVEPLARAAELAPKGDLYVRLAQIHMMQESWGQATEALQAALAKGGLADPANAELLLGISCYNERRLHEARSWFSRAQQSVAVRNQAATWIEHVDRALEQERAGAGVGG
jgi:tetratricopeptide (TPR) repeat protein